MTAASDDPLWESLRKVHPASSETHFVNRSRVAFHTTPRLFRRERYSRIASPSTNTNRAHKSLLKRNLCLAASCTRKS